MKGRRNTDSNPDNGIYWREDAQKYLVQLNWNHQTYSLGYYANKADARDARDEFDTARIQASDPNNHFSRDEIKELMDQTAETLRHKAAYANKHNRTKRRVSQIQRLTNVERSVDQLKQRIDQMEAKLNQKQ